MNNKGIIFEYNLLIEEVKRFVLELESQEKFQKVLKKYYRGIHILYGPLVFKPKVLFIGINPGAGFYNFKKKRVKYYDPLDNFEYLHYKYLLASQSRSLFKRAGLSLENCVKTNCFFFSTRNEDELHKFAAQFEDSELYRKSAVWRHRLINLIQPEIIVCEGKSAFDWVTKNIPIENIEDDGKVLTTNYDGIKVLGYRRNKSFISNIEHVAKRLKNISNQI